MINYCFHIILFWHYIGQNINKKMLKESWLWVVIFCQPFIMKFSNLQEKWSLTVNIHRLVTQIL